MIKKVWTILAVCDGGCGLRKGFSETKDRTDELFEIRVMRLLRTKHRWRHFNGRIYCPNCISKALESVFYVKLEPQGLKKT